MPNIRLMTFNVENMLVRFDFRKWEKERLATLLDVDSDMDRANLIRTHWNVINEENRVFTALSIREADPDVICLQEVEDMWSLKSFHDRYLRRISGRDYKYKILIEGNDLRGINVALISRFMIERSTSHQHIHKEIQYPNVTRREPVFRRDCLEVEIKKENKILPIFVCHFKSMSGGRNQTSPIRRAEASTVKEILEDRFGDPSSHDWVVAGDLNDYTETDGIQDINHGLGPLLDDGFSSNLVSNIVDPKDRWTHFYGGEGSYHQLDYLLVSPSLKDKNPDLKPKIVRNGQPFRAERYTGDRWPRVGYDRPKASDHCPVLADLKY